MELIFFLILFILIYPINKFIENLNFLPSQTGETHQNFLGKKNVPLSGGLFILIFIIFLYKNNIYLSISFLIFFILGLCADKKFIISPSKRFILQMLFIISFVLFFNLEVADLRNPFLSSLLENKLISNFFIIICFLVLINGSNFIDGLNGLQLGYYLIVVCILLKNNLLNLIDISFNNSIVLILLMIYLLILNFKNKLFLGDNGSYILSLLLGFILINIYNSDRSISPFFIALLLWYPCFENLFSILRKFNLNRSPLKPDNKHLHQLVFLYFKMKYKINKNLANNLSSLAINSVNLIIIFLASLKYNHTLLQLFLIFTSSLIYVYFYIRILRTISRK
tara:strand:- start:369 stop:1382 length:1014 start_codon:yes stop_codon:yes gene_type:complete